MTNCAICGKTHETYVREMPDGSSHVYVDAATQARRVKVARETNARIRATAR